MGTSGIWTLSTKVKVLYSTSNRPTLGGRPLPETIVVLQDNRHPVTDDDSIRFDSIE